MSRMCPAGRRYSTSEGQASEAKRDTRAGGFGGPRQARRTGKYMQMGDYRIMQLYTMRSTEREGKQ